jgi:hypothetical protein
MYFRHITVQFLTTSAIMQSIAIYDLYLYLAIQNLLFIIYRAGVVKAPIFCNRNKEECNQMDT